jgi:hypothetical protein
MEKDKGISAALYLPKVRPIHSSAVKKNSPFLLQPIPQFKNFHFYLSLPFVLDYSLVRLALAVLEVFDCARVRRGVVAGFEVRAVALDVA